MLVSLVACGAAESQVRQTDGGSVSVPFVTDGWRTDFSKHSVPLDEIMSGGPPKDGIPAIDRPKFDSVREADRWLGDREPIVVFERDGEVRGYPWQVLIWHEIVNDEVGGLPVSITYCPLCNTAIAFDRRVDSMLLDFGTTGKLRHSDLVMYDRQTETWWQQATGEAIIGELTGTVLTFLSAPTVSWSDFKREYPDAKVLNRDTGHRRPYGTSPYDGYDTGDPWLFRGRSDNRLPTMARVVVVKAGDAAVAYPMERRRSTTRWGRRRWQSSTGGAQHRRSTPSRSRRGATSVPQPPICAPSTAMRLRSAPTAMDSGMKRPVRAGPFSVKR